MFYWFLERRLGGCFRYLDMFPFNTWCYHTSPRRWRAESSCWKVIKRLLAEVKLGKTLLDDEAIVLLFDHSGDLLGMTESAPIWDYIPLQSHPFTEGKRQATACTRR